LNKISKKYARIEGRPMHYFGDGSGRDFYVMYTLIYDRSNEGGLTERNSGKKNNFLRTLRAPIMRNERKKADAMELSKDSWKSRNSVDLANSTSLSFYQTRHAKRLSEPKKYGDPY
jgi:hypothetical protein